MRPAGIVGIVLIVLGALALWRGGSFTTKHDVLKIGDLKVTASEEKAIPEWAGAMAIVLGVVLVVAGSRKPA